MTGYFLCRTQRPAPLSKRERAEAKAAEQFTRKAGRRLRVSTVGYLRAVRGLTLKQCGDVLGVSGERVRAMQYEHERQAIRFDWVIDRICECAPYQIERAAETVANRFGNC
jgi:hypothetical protein